MRRGLLKSYTPTARERVMNWMNQTFYGDSRQGQDKARSLLGTLDYTPVGSLLGLYDAGRAGASGDALSAGMNLAMAGIPGPAKKGIRAFHGSPHDFDKFSLDKIGTGEGAQAYGHGLYFAENENVARDYKHTLANGFEFQGKRVDPNSELGRTLDWLKDAKPDMPIADAISQRATDLRKHADFMRSQGGYEAQSAEMYDRAADKLLQLDPKDIKRAGRMYEVNINADPEQFLDWDKPLSEHPENIRNAAIEARQAAARAEYEQRGLPPELIEEYLGNAARSDMSQKTGGQFVQGIRGADVSPQFSESLKQRGIPGIKYLDQGSRGAGDGTRNYVVFDDKLVEILRKYGLLPPVAAAGGSLLGSLQNNQEQY